MKIHSPNAHKKAAVQKSDFFYNYFTMGFVSFDEFSVRSMHLNNSPFDPRLGRPLRRQNQHRQEVHLAHKLSRPLQFQHVWNDNYWYDISLNTTDDIQ